MSAQDTLALTFTPLSEGQSENIACLWLNRPSAANALDGAMFAQIPELLERASRNSGTRALVLRGAGKVFCGGADISWMRASAQLDLEQNKREAAMLRLAFESLYRFPLPTIAVVHGSAFGGAVGLCAASDVVLAEASTRFALSEVRLGILPAVIMPYLMDRIAPGPLRRWIFSGRPFGATEAHQGGLVDSVGTGLESLDISLCAELNQLLAASPDAQIVAKGLYQTLAATDRHGEKAAAVTIEAIAKARTASFGQEGLQAFLSKTPPTWLKTLPNSWRLVAP